MKRLLAFVTAGILFLCFVLGVHVWVVNNMPVQNREVGVWIDYYKDISYEMIHKNIDKKTVFLMGSSEFHHRNKSYYHPSNFFKDKDIDVMCIGGAYNQCLTHTIAMGAFGQDLQSKKAVLFLSPSWFYTERNQKQEFGLRFSQTQYIKLMNNPKISDQLKEKIQKRVNSLSEASIGLEKNTPLTMLKSKLLNEKERINSTIMWRKSLKEPKISRKSFGSTYTNPYNMNDNFFARKVTEKTLREKKNSNKGKSFFSADEYNDLQIFLDMCKEQGIEVLLVLQPMNGTWFDYTGLTEEKRQVVPERVKAIAEKNQVSFSDLTKDEYTRGFFIDAVHPSDIGWETINEEVYQFIR